MLLSLVSATAARPPRSSANRPTSSAAACCASAALPPLPNSSSFPPPASAVRTATAAAPGCGRPAPRPPGPNSSSSPPPAGAAGGATAASITGRGSAFLTRSWSAIVSANAAVSTSLSSKAILLDVRPELLCRHLQRRGGRRMHVDLDRIVLPERIALPVLGHQQPPRIRMAIEHDAEEIPDLALEPIGSGPDSADRRDVRVGVGQPHFHADPPAVRERDEHVDQLEPRFARIVIRRGQLGEKGELQLLPVPEQARRRRYIVAPDIEGLVQIDGRYALEPGARQRFLQRRDDRVRLHYASFWRSIFRCSWTMP